MSDEEKVGQAWRTGPAKNVRMAQPLLKGDSDDAVEVLPVRLPTYRVSVTFENAETGDVLMSTTTSGQAKFVSQVAAGAADSFLDVVES